MTRDIPVGTTFTRTFTVDDTRAISFMGPELRVYATPWIVQDLEYACRDWLLEHIAAEEDSVGFRVKIQHKRGTPLGMTVTHTVTVATVDRDRVTFEIAVRDPIEEVATARHTRVIVEKARLARIVQAKRDRVRI
ncbi:MAG: LysR family transcriptional regulator [Pseudomonadota bacterium]